MNAAGRLILCLGLTMVFSSNLYAGNSRLNRFSPWAVYYAENASYDDLANYELLVFDSDRHPPLSPLKKQGKILLGYISLGEVQSQRSYFKEVRQQGLQHRALYRHDIGRINLHQL